MVKKYFFYFVMVCMTFFCAVGAATVFILLVELLLEQPTTPSQSGHVPATSVYPYPYVMYKAPPNLDEVVSFPTQTGEPFFNHVQTESNGYRYSEISPEPTHKSIRGFILGGSVVFMGSNNNTTISGYLEEMIESSIPEIATKVEVINAGFLGAVSDQELSLLVHEVVDFQPDFVIVLDGYNDLIHPYQYHSKLGLPVHWEQYKDMILEGKKIVQHIEKRSAISNILSSTWFGRSVLGAPSFHESLELKPQEQSVPEIVKEFSQAIMDGRTDRRFTQEEQKIIYQYIPTKDQIMHHYISNWKQMSNIALMNNIDSLFVLQPYNLFPVAFNNINLYEMMKEKIAAISHQQAVFKTNSASFLEMANIFDDRKELFFDGVHVNDEGNQLIAEHLFQVIKKENLIQKWINN